jgi:hypothetical protein
MGLSENELDGMIAKVSGSRVDQDALQFLARIAQSAESARPFVDALVASQTASGSGGYQAVASTMHILESIADRSELVGCTFMAILWKNANEIRMHDICDSIDLWVSNNKSAELRQHLLMLAQSEDEEYVKQHYEQLAN